MTDFSRQGEPTALAELHDGVDEPTVWAELDEPAVWAELDEPTVWAELCVVLQRVVLCLPPAAMIVVQLGDVCAPVAIDPGSRD
jgi:hypothetical protein